jgi:hypothetical protein
LTLCPCSLSAIAANRAEPGNSPEISGKGSKSAAARSALFEAGSAGFKAALSRRLSEDAQF